MLFHCPLCASIQEITPPIDSSWTVQCADCRKTFKWSNELIVPYCYACLSEDVAVFLQTPIGLVFGCLEHGENVSEFWLLPMIKFTAASGNHARQYDGSPSGSGPGGNNVKKRAAGKS